MKHKPSIQHINQPVQSTKINGETFSQIKFQSLFSIVEKSLDDNRLWVSDFRNDGIFVTDDLYDVISAYQHFHREIRESR